MRIGIYFKRRSICKDKYLIVKMVLGLAHELKPYYIVKLGIFASVF